MPDNFLLEIGADEIPARYLSSAIRDLSGKSEAALTAARLSCTGVRALGTPRRLALLVSGLSERSQDAVTKVRGPSKKVAYDGDGNPTRALQGFSRSLGIDPSQVTLEEDNGGEYVYGERREPGRSVFEVLAEIIPPVVMGLESPHPMRWGDQDWRWYRPIRWVVSLYGSEVVHMSIAGVESGRRTLGHRTLHPGPLDIPSAGGYVEIMGEASVVVDPCERERIIVEGARAAASVLGGVPLIDAGLLSEVSSLCEHPAAFLGRFDEKYERLPKEVLVTAMRHHQRYFPVGDDSGNLLPGFVGVRDGDPLASIDTVRSGNEWVLRARLEDAEFFFQQDIKTRLEDRIPELEGIRFLKNSGTMLDKAHRIRQLASHIAVDLGLSEADRGLAEEAALLAKADLVTAMVREFPELEGIMGGRYGEMQGLAPAVTEALRDQYLPRGAKDSLPHPGIPSAVALADKLDTLAVSFSLGMEVSGSADPYGLRRHALGAVGILLGHGYDVDLEGLLDLPLELAITVVKEPVASARERLLQFLLGRVEGVLMERGFTVEIVRALLGGGEKRVSRLPDMAQSLFGLAGTGQLGDVVTGWRRTSVLAKGAVTGEVCEDLLAEDPEKALYRAFVSNKGRLDCAYERKQYGLYLSLLAQMRSPIDSCLDQVLIMADDPAVRANRLGLLRGVSRLFTRYADFAHILPLI